MTMMQVWIVRMLVPHRGMDVPVRVRLGYGIVMCMLMVHIMPMGVFVSEFVMRMFVIMRFRQMKPNAYPHEDACDNEPDRERFI